ncbi:glycyl-radical enzyme activating protein family [Olsenella uli DSM 7084]|uniref:Glycyl-radical enzyme activating protein family n=1 Tax=Olsenella uli (strain ATCC 49627 / DSM 7084 / CCUG 31166 / CIP 109912 / JCM 12494 / LMG 11480 / NCIMB 702895 / VPI D76D-27C) TaxID=633147 RepID=E1QVI6_OLSUV|nr:4-hydroxyphenylacetate decarboxylase activase [Olsenella uli]ADK68139.1 glycyl-radical enzyme activating protein family [Olsenella uli DSM 7084]
MSEQLTGMVFDIQSYSVHDGPGCRTNVFLDGCPLECRWCANPESQRPRKQLMFAERTCKWDQGCRACRDACPHGSLAVSDEAGPSFNWKACLECETIECVNSCAAGALKQPVREMTVDGLLGVLDRDRSNWGSDGGVTFTGGEPLMQSDFLVEVLKGCRKTWIHTAIETSGFTSTERFLEVFKRIDFAFVDMKNMDDEAHVWGTGVSNKQILRNISALAQTNWPGRLVLRVPTIAGYNDSDENARQVIDFMNENDLYEINLLKFHRMGQTKWEQLGLEYEYANKGDMDDERMSELQDMYLDAGIACYVGDDTPF